MTNNIDLNKLGAPEVQYTVPNTFKTTHYPDGTTKVEGIETLPWNTAHLRCKCGHKWDDHRGLGCEKCNCLQ